MKIKIIKTDYDSVISMTPRKSSKPKRPWLFWRVAMKMAGLPDLLATKFKCEKIGMEKLGKKEPCFVLMNHSSFIDLEIVANVMFPKPFNIVATTDGFVGKDWLMRQIGCIPTKKFVSELSLVKDIKYTVEKNKCSVIMFPEAGYSFDGTTTRLPDTLGKFIKMMKIPLVFIITDGAFLRDPLYNNLQKRKVKVSAKMEYALSPEQIEEMSADEINELIKEKFSFDYFKLQQENKVKVDEPFRADYLNRVLYKCPHCMTEGSMKGEGTTISCGACGKSYELDEYGYLRAEDAKFSHIPDWYAWQRACVRKELEDGEYSMDVPVDICMSVDTKAIYRVGEGRLIHNGEGFHLVGCDGKLDYVHTPQSSYSLYADYYWYEVGDVICIGNHKALYYCFPQVKGDFVAKARLATEELYEMTMKAKRDK